MLCQTQLRIDRHAEKVNAARREATAEEKRMNAKQFAEAKYAEYKSWKEKDVFELITIMNIKVALWRWMGRFIILHMLPTIACLAHTCSCQVRFWTGLCLPRGLASASQLKVSCGVDETRHFEAETRI